MESWSISRKPSYLTALARYARTNERLMVMAMKIMTAGMYNEKGAIIRLGIEYGS